MSAVCPNGHTSQSDDYCDTCGSPIDANAQPAAGAGPTGSSPGSTNAAATTGGSSLDLDPAPTADPAGGSGGGAGGSAAAPAVVVCPNCQTENPDGALFCEACGYDFTTGAMPRDPSAPTEEGEDGADGAAPAADDSATGDPASASTSESASESASGQGSEPAAATSPAPAPAAGGAASEFEWLAEVWIDPDWYQTQEAEDPCPSPGLPIIVPLRHRSVLLGRVSSSKNTNPEIDLSSDPGVSRRHAQLTTDGSRWFVEDLGSSNGTFVGSAAGPLPEKALAVGPKTELDDDDRLYVGAWTRVVVRRATPDEVEAYA